MSRNYVLFALGVFLAFLVSPIQAQTWTPQVSGNWSSGSNWNPGAPPAGGGPTVLLNFSGANAAYTATNDLGNPFVVNGITFGQRFTNATTIASAAANTIELGGANPFIGSPLVGGIDSSLTANFTSTINLNPSSGSVTFGSAGLGTLALSGVISSTGSVPVIIAGNNNAPNWSFVRLLAANTFTGPVAVSGGHLVIGNATALGDVSNVLTFNSGSIGATTAVTVANNITLNNDIQFLAQGSILTLSGVISGNHGLRLSGLTSSTTGVNLTGANTYTGQTLLTTGSIMGQGTNGAVNNGVVTVSGASGSIASSSGIVLRSGGTLALNDVTAFTGGAAGRVGDTAGVTVAGSHVTLTAGTAANYAEVMGALTLESGYNAVSITATASGAAEANFASMTRQNRATALFRGTSLGNTPGVNVGTVSFATAPTGDLVGGGGAASTTTISILPYAVGDTLATGTLANHSLVTLDSGRIRPLDTGTEYVTTMTGGATTTDNVRLTASLDLASAGLTTSNALVMTTGTLSNSSGGAFRPTSGVILVTGAATISAPVDFGSAEGIVYAPTTLAMSGVIAGTNGLTKSGQSTLTLSGTNTYSGTTTINSGVLSINGSAALGSSSTIQVGGGNNTLNTVTTRPGLTYSGTTAVALSQNITVNSGLFAPLASTATGTLQLDGQISGAGGLYVSTTGNVILTNNSNNYTGMTRIFSGNLVISNDAQLGNGGAVDIGALSTAGMILNGDWTTSRHVNVSFASQVNTNGNNWNQNGAFTGTSAINKAGAGTFNLNTTSAASTNTGAIGVLAGRMNVNGFLATSTNAVTVSSAAILGGTGEIDRPVTFNAGSIIAPGLSPGNLTLSSRSAAAATLAAGTIYEFEINNATGAMGVNWDRLLATNSPISLPNALTIQLVGLTGGNTPGAVTNFNSGSDYLWEFMTAPSFSGTAFGSIAFTIDDTQFVNNNPLAGGTFSIVQVGSTGLGVQFISAIPEPGSMALLGGMLVAACNLRNRRRQV